LFVLAFLKNHFVKNDFSAENKTAILISFWRKSFLIKERENHSLW
jgi:hypothetical protein